MAVRSGAGTGVIVSLIVFVLLTIFGVAMSIVFYAGKSEAEEKEAAARNDLTRYVSSQERGTDRFKGFEQASGSKSVAGYLSGRYDDLARFITSGGDLKSVDEIKADLSQFNLPADGTLRNALEDGARKLRSSSQEVESLKAKLAERERTIAERDALIARMESDHSAEIAKVGQNVNTYRSAGEQYAADVERTKAFMNERVESDRVSFEERITELEDELNECERERTRIRTRLDEHEAILNEIRLKGSRPELLVDGAIVEVDPGNAIVTIDRGRAHRIVLGMTFEVYDDAGAIRPDPRTGAMPRGKASVQVTKVNETTAICKITRDVGGRPVVRNNVVANAVYDPARVFKFMVHGKFDVDSDGTPSDTEADYIRSLIIDWGGQVVSGEDMPGDLDFLVLGVAPPTPAPLAANATPVQFELWSRQRNASAKYQELFNQASEAQIPVLNANRFMILIGRNAN